MSGIEDPGASGFADPQLAELIAEVNSRPATTDVTAMREGSAQRAGDRPTGPEMATVRDLLVPAGRRVPAVPVRLYRPRPGHAPLVVHAHGGGWTIGSLDTHDRICRRLAHASGVAVLSVDYRLAPEHPAPAAVDDMVHVLEWVATTPSELDPGPGAVAVAGDSAGGTVAALSCLRLRDALSAALPQLQVLAYANTDLTGPGASMHEKASGWGLDVSGVQFFNHQWVPDPKRWADPDISPLRAPDLRNLPPALIVTAEHDPLRDQGEAYAVRLREAGVSVDLRREAGMVHNFLMYDEASPACARAADRLARDLGHLLDSFAGAGPR